MNRKFKKFLRKTKHGRLVTISNCVICSKKKSIFTKNQEASGLQSNLGVEMYLSKVPLRGSVLF